jgi:hypothetical protein
MIDSSTSSPLRTSISFEELIPQFRAAPHGEQARDPKILELIKLRSQVGTSADVYRQEEEDKK